MEPHRLLQNIRYKAIIYEHSQTTMNKKDQFITDQKGNKIAIVVSIKEYDELIDDLHDLKIIAERKSEENISLEEMKNELSK